MSRLMQMRQRMKAVGTIKKITHAMRLISMSSHSRMQHRQKPLTRYKETISELFLRAQKTHPRYKNPILSPEEPEDANPLIILVGSQKGLCGSFNSALFQLFTLRTIGAKKDTAIITVGKKATNFIEKKAFGKLVAFFNTFAAHNMLIVANSLLQEILQAKRPYSSVVIYSSIAKSFFAQKPQANTIIPAKAMAKEIETIDYAWEQPATQVLDYLAYQYILSNIQQALFQSLLAEHAARFVSMDSSTRNAETLLETMQLDYNKLRQTKITRELAELSSFFID